MKSSRGPSLGFWRTWALVVGSAMGSSVFLLPAMISPYGGIGLLGLAAAAIGGMSVALTFSYLARQLPAAGGPIAYTRAAFGDFAGFLVGWIYWVGIWAACGAIAIAIPGYLAQLIPAVAQSPLASVGIALGVLWITVLVNWWGVREAGIVGLVVTVLKLAPLIVICVVGVFWIDWRNLPAWNPSTNPPLVAFAGVFAIAFWNFIGIEAATVPADDVVDAGRTIPRATIAGVLTCIGIYLLVALVSMSLIPAADLNVASTPLALVGARLAGPWGAATISVAALGSICAVLHYTVLVGGQAPAAAARAGLFPAIFGRRSRRGTPGFSLFFAGILVTVLVILNSQKGVVNAYRFMALISTLSSVIPYAICAVAVFLLPPTAGTGPSARRSAVIIAAVAFIVSLVVVAGAGMEAVYWTMLLILAGLPLFALIRRKSVAP